MLNCVVNNINPNINTSPEPLKELRGLYRYGISLCSKVSCTGLYAGFWLIADHSLLICPLITCVSSLVISCWCEHTNIRQPDLNSNHCVVGGKYFNRTSHKLSPNEWLLSNPTGTAIFNYNITEVMESFGVFYMINSCLWVYTDTLSASGQTASRWRITVVSTVGGGRWGMEQKMGGANTTHMQTVGLEMGCLGIAWTVRSVLILCSKVGGAEGAEVVALDVRWLW